MLKQLFIPFLFFAVCVQALSQVSNSRKLIDQYVAEFKDDAIREMNEDGVPASITLAQGILESDAGNSLLAREANNHFGIKCHNEWSGPVYVQDDDTKNECFRKYETVFDSYVDHSAFLKSRTRYAFLFTLDRTDYESWAYGLKSAGYATDPKYAQRLVKIIEEHKLNRFDTLMSVNNEPLTASLNNEVAYNKKIQQISNSKYSKPVSSQVRSVKFINNRKCITAVVGETIDEISKEYDVDPRLVHRYNDLKEDKKVRFRHGDIIFLQPKRKKSQEEFHIVAKGETMYVISQKYGIKLKSLYKKNKMEVGSEPKVGDRVWLRRTKKK